jgi:RluA family pseudouridine synthase
LRVVVEPGGAGKRLDRYLADRFPGFSRALIMKYLKEGRARVNGFPTRPGAALRAGDGIDLPEWEEALREIRGGKAEGIPPIPRAKRDPLGIDVLHEDGQIVVIVKPSGLVMHPGKGHADEGLDRILWKHFGKGTRLVHRLDRDTSGVVVAAKGHPESARRLAEAFESGDVEKTYFALVAGVPAELRGTIDLPLLDTKELGTNVRVDPRGRAARTDYAVMRSFGGRFAWLKVNPKTGRRHQIRAHLAHIGHPLAVDHVYGRASKLKLRDLRPDLPITWKNPVVLARIPLHAAEITFRHPATGEDVTFSAPIPDDIARVLDLLGGGAPGDASELGS